MPELPDVATFKRYIDATSLHQQISQVDVRSDKVLEGVSESDLKRAVIQLCFERTLRHGKNLFVEMEPGTWLRLHFGMTGFLQYFKRPEDEHQHSRLLFSFANGFHISYVCQRQIGRVSLIKSPDEYIERAGLGPDAVEVDLEGFKSIMAGTRGGIKSALMNQETIAGIGNIYADEILFQARINPAAGTGQLNDRLLEMLYTSVQEVLNTAIKANADPEKFPQNYIIPRREEGQECPQCGTKIQRKKINQRSAYFCPACQSRP